MDQRSLSETIIGLFKAEVVYQRHPRRHGDSVEYPTLESIGNMQPEGFEMTYYLRKVD